MRFFDQQWREQEKIYSTYAHDGSVIKTDEVAETYATLLGYFSIVHPDTAEEIYDKKLKPLYNQDTNSWREQMTYYADNWVWFGIALHEHKLDNLAKELQ